MEEDDHLDPTRLVQNQELRLIKRPTKVSKAADRIPKPRPGLPGNSLPLWNLLNLEDKVPVPPAPNGLFTISRTELAEPLFLSSKNQEFDTLDPYLNETPIEYNSLHDPHLKVYFQSHPYVVKQLVDFGLITENGDVVCKIAELNKYRMYLSRTHKVQITNERNREENLYADGKQQIKRIKRWILKQKVDTRAEETARRRSALQRAHERKLNLIRRKYEDHPSSWVNEHRAEKNLILRRKRELRKRHVAARLNALKKAQLKRTRMILLHIICEEDFSQRLRDYMDVEKRINYCNDLQNFIDNKRKYQTDKLRYHRALIRRDAMERECRIEKREAYYCRREVQDKENVKKRLKIERQKQERIFYLMNKYGRRWLQITLRSHQDSRHESTWHVRNLLRESRKVVKDMSGAQSFSSVLKTLLFGVDDTDPLKECDPETREAVKAVMDTLVNCSYNEFIQRATSCLVDFAINKARLKCIQHVCEEGLDPSDLQEPIIPTRLRNQIKIPPPVRPCVGPCAELSDWKSRCAKMVNELEGLHDDLSKRLECKLKDDFSKDSDRDGKNIGNLRQSVMKAKQSKDMDAAAQTVAGIVLDRTSSLPADEKMQAEFADYAAERLRSSVAVKDSKGKGKGQSRKTGGLQHGKESAIVSSTSSPITENISDTADQIGTNALCTSCENLQKEGVTDLEETKSEIKPISSKTLEGNLSETGSLTGKKSVVAEMEDFEEEGLEEEPLQDLEEGLEDLEEEDLGDLEEETLEGEQLEDESEEKGLQNLDEEGLEDLGEGGLEDDVAKTVSGIVTDETSSQQGDGTQDEFGVAIKDSKGKVEEQGQKIGGLDTATVSPSRIAASDQNAKALANAEMRGRGIMGTKSKIKPSSSEAVVGKASATGGVLGEGPVVAALEDLEGLEGEGLDNLEQQSSEKPEEKGVEDLKEDLGDKDLQKLAEEGSEKEEGPITAVISDTAGEIGENAICTSCDNLEKDGSEKEEGPITAVISDTAGEIGENAICTSCENLEKDDKGIEETKSKIKPSTSDALVEKVRETGSILGKETAALQEDTLENLKDERQQDLEGKGLEKPGSEKLESNLGDEFAKTKIGEAEYKPTLDKRSEPAPATSRAPSVPSFDLTGKLSAVASGFVDQALCSSCKDQFPEEDVKLQNKDSLTDRVANDLANSGIGAACSDIYGDQPCLLRDGAPTDSSSGIEIGGRLSEVASGLVTKAICTSCKDREWKEIEAFVASTAVTTKSPSTENEINLDSIPSEIVAQAICSSCNKQLELAENDVNLSHKDSLTDGVAIDLANSGIGAACSEIYRDQAYLSRGGAPTDSSSGIEIGGRLSGVASGLVSKAICTSCKEREWKEIDAFIASTAVTTRSPFDNLATAKEIKLDYSPSQIVDNAIIRAGKNICDSNYQVPFNANPIPSPSGVEVLVEPQSFESEGVIRSIIQPDMNSMTYPMQESTVSFMDADFHRLTSTYQAMGKHQIHEDMTRIQSIASVSPIPRQPPVPPPEPDVYLTATQTALRKLRSEIEVISKSLETRGIGDKDKPEPPPKK